MLAGAAGLIQLIQQGIFALTGNDHQGGAPWQSITDALNKVRKRRPD
jgi:hypothetical protein